MAPAVAVPASFDVGRFRMLIGESSLSSLRILLVVSMLFCGCGAPAVDSGAPTEPPTLVAPMIGATTGSIHVPAGSSVVDHPLKPRFMWLPLSDATSYEIELEDDCAVAGWEQCSFPSPIALTTMGEAAPSGEALVFRPQELLSVSATRPVGSRYVWRVRGCTDFGCGPWSAVRYLNVGRDAHDFNGDGYADLVVGAMSQDNPAINEGNTFVYYGSATGVGLDASITLDNPSDQDGGLFGGSVAAAGDLNADGYADLVVGAQQQDGAAMDEGKAYVYYGSSTGIAASPSVTLDNPSGQEAGVLGVSVAGAGDLDGDGYDDLVVGAPRQDNPAIDEGTAYVYYGSLAGITATPSVVLDNPADQQDGYFGMSVAGVGDLNGDGYPELTVGARGQDSPAIDVGSAYVYYGSKAGLETAPSVTLDSPVDEAGGYFGRWVTRAGDLNGDGYGDLGIGAMYQDGSALDEGAAYVYYGSPVGVAATPSVTLANPMSQANAAFGSRIASAGDLNGDGYTDLVVGAPFQSNPEVQEGNAFVYYGDAGGVTTQPSMIVDNPTDRAGGQFGSSATGADLNGDGYADLVIGASQQSNPEWREGNVFIFPGSPSEPSDAVLITLDNPADQVEGGFGMSVAMWSPVVDCVEWRASPKPDALGHLPSPCERRTCLPPLYRVPVRRGSAVSGGMWATLMT